jgi:hypothetical protein
MTALRRCLVVLACATALPALAGAQDSQFGLMGPGTPVRFESARARATGGAFAPFDALSWMTDAAMADLRRLTATAQGIASYRQVEIESLDATLRSTRFSTMLFAAPIGPRLVLATGFGSYLDRTYRTRQRDSTVIRGEMETFTDVIASDGGVTDIRFAGAWRFSRRIAAGAALHLLAGTTRASATRTFDDSATYGTAFEVTDVQHTGAGVSAGAAVDVLTGLRLALWLRSDTELKVSVADEERARYGLPNTFGGGLRWAVSPELRFAGYVQSQSWSDAGGRDVVSWGVGIEGGSAAMPARLGIRGADMPFAPVGVEPKEFAVAAGFGRSFSQGRARLDFTLERLTRTGGELRETVWSVLFGMTVQP